MSKFVQEWIKMLIIGGIICVTLFDFMGLVAAVAGGAIFAALLIFTDLGRGLRRPRVILVVLRSYPGVFVTSHPAECELQI